MIARIVKCPRVHGDPNVEAASEVSEVERFESSENGKLF